MSATHHVRSEPRENKRRLLFVIIVLLAAGLIVLGIKLGDPSTIHHFAAQI